MRRCVYHFKHLQMIHMIARLPVWAVILILLGTWHTNSILSVVYCNTYCISWINAGADCASSMKDVSSLALIHM